MLTLPSLNLLAAVNVFLEKDHEFQTLSAGIACIALRCPRSRASETSGERQLGCVAANKRQVVLETVKGIVRPISSDLTHNKILVSKLASSR